jgi:hypothetical protein
MPLLAHQTETHPLAVRTDSGPEFTSRASWPGAVDTTSSGRRAG